MLDTRKSVDSEEQSAEYSLELQEKIKAIGAGIEKTADELVGKRNTVEDRWYRDIRQKHGRYDEDTEAKLKAAKKSRLYVKLTRPKCKIWAAKLTDLLFPTDDKNWGMKATPIPELMSVVDDEPKEEEIETAQQEFAEAQKSGLDTGRQQEQIVDMTARMDKGESARDYQDNAKKAALGMERECEDQLIETQYARAAREAIDDAVEGGTGVIKGPYDSGKPRKRWVKQTSTDEAGGQSFNWVQVDEATQMPQPAFSRVDYWAFFPDPDATRIEEAEYTYERHVLTAKDLRSWSRNHGFDRNTIRQLLSEGVNQAAPEYLTKVRAITLQETASLQNKYIVWEYRGPLDVQDMQMLFEQAGDEDGLDHLSSYDPLDEIDVVLYVSGGEVIKFGISSLDSNECIYSVFNLVKDSASIWGFGVPYLMRDSQAAINAAWRMMMDNGGLSTGPQIVINRKVVSPVNGSWVLEPRKLWYLNETLDKGRGKPFEAFAIDSRQTELANIISIAKEFVDEETNLPAIAQGDQSAGSKNTFGGMALMANAANVVFRDAVREFDDCITVPCLRRLFDWNMQFNPKDEIKGDIKIDARGSSVLLVREIQSQNMLLMLQNFSNDPVLGRLLKSADLLRKTVQGMMLTADDIVFTDEEIEEAIKAEQEQERKLAEAGSGMSPEEVRLQGIEIEAETKRYVADITRETAMIKMASDNDMTVEKLAHQLKISREQMQSRERSQAAEAGIKDRDNKQEIEMAKAGGDTSKISEGTGYAS